MIRYNVTAKLSSIDIINEYTTWLNNGHIQAVIDSGAINGEYSVSIKDNNSIIEVTALYIFPSIDIMNQYINITAPILRQDAIKLFIEPKKVLGYERFIGKVNFYYQSLNITKPIIIEKDMIRYNVIATLASKEYLDEYTTWLSNGHIQAVVNSGGLCGEYNILQDNSNNNNEEENLTIRVASIYLFPNMDALNNYFNGVALILRQDGITKFVETKKVLKFDRYVGTIGYATNNEHNFLSPSDISPYIHYNGQCREAITYYQNILQGETQFMELDSNLPNSLILHSQLQINQESNNNEQNKIIPSASTIMSSDYIITETSPIQEEFRIGNNVCIALNFSSYSKIQSIYSTLSQDGEVFVPLTKQFWNAYFSHFSDKYHVNWYLNMQIPDEFVSDDTKVELNEPINISPYIRFNGRCEEAMKFYHHILGGILELNEFPDENSNTNCDNNEKIEQQKEDQEKEVEDNQTIKKRKKNILHSSITFEKGLSIMACDSGHYDGIPIEGNNMVISLKFSNEIGINSCYYALSDGGKIIQPLGKPFWGGLFGQFIDKFGIQWMVLYNDNNDMN